MYNLYYIYVETFCQEILLIWIWMSKCVRKYFSTVINSLLFTVNCLISCSSEFIQSEYDPLFIVNCNWWIRHEFFDYLYFNSSVSSITGISTSDAESQSILSSYQCSSTELYKWLLSFSHVNTFFTISWRNVKLEFLFRDLVCKIPMVLGSFFGSWFAIVI